MRAEAGAIGGIYVLYTYINMTSPLYLQSRAVPLGFMQDTRPTATLVISLI